MLAILLWSFSIIDNSALQSNIPIASTYTASEIEAILRYNESLDANDTNTEVATQNAVMSDFAPLKAESIYCSCVKTARAEGLNLPVGDADNLVSNSLPVEGGGILLKYGKVHHVAKILNFTPSGFLIVEGNKVKCKKTYRVVLFNDPAINGFWTPAPSL